ncbi:MAG: carboxypeptidase regulatory-like domain-containing protein [Flavobacteriales bacterium]|nr:carboxypeptidase regulatory-like domain-containing protein [Flavobacteriales bacterium]
MKKLLFLLLICLSAYQSFSQGLKSKTGDTNFKGLVLQSGTPFATFVDTIVNNSNSNYTSFKVATDQDNYSHYVVGKHDNFMYKQDYYISKYNHAGALIFDTVIRVIPIASMPFTEIYSLTIKDKELKILSNYENSNYKKLPMIINADTTGTIIWIKYYDTDSIYLNAENGYQATDGYFIYGAADATEFDSGFLIKTDASGTIVWSNFYAYKDTVTNVPFYSTINNLIESPDGGYIFTLTASDYQNNVHCVYKINANGEIDWKYTLNFDSNIKLNQSYINGISKIDDLNYVISMSIYDSIIDRRAIELIVIDPLTGIINNTKAYKRPNATENIELNDIIVKNDGNFVGSYNDDFNGTHLIEMKPDLTITQNVLIREFPDTSVEMNTYIQDYKPTPDGGVIMVANRAGYDGGILFKTDNTLKTNCPEVYYDIIPGDTVYNVTLDVFCDTVLSYYLTENTVFNDTLTAYDHPFVGTSCSCINNLSGYISVNSIPSDSISVVLYKDYGFGPFIPIGIVETDANGYYNFDFLPEGDFLVKAVPSDIKYPDYLPTFFKFGSNTSHWTGADTIFVTCGMNPYSFNIDMIQKFAQSGSWMCSGYVLEGDTGIFNERNQNGGSGHHTYAPGEPIPDIDITIDQSPGGTVSSTTTDINGYFEFAGLNNSATFVVKANIPGLPNDSVYTFTVNPGDGALDSLLFYVANDTVYIITDTITSVSELKILEYNLTIAPNPTKDNIKFNILSAEELNLDIQMTNTLGDVLLTKKQKISFGKNTFDLETKDYPPGIYFVKITEGKETIIKKVIKQ